MSALSINRAGHLLNVGLGLSASLIAVAISLVVWLFAFDSSGIEPGGATGHAVSRLWPIFFMFAGILVEGAEKFGQVIEVSDPKTEVGVVNNRNGEGFESINIRLKANCSLRLHKDTETVITFHSTSPAVFHVMDS